MGALNFLPGQPQKWAAGTGRNKVLLVVESLLPPAAITQYM